MLRAMGVTVCKPNEHCCFELAVRSIPQHLQAHRVRCLEWVAHGRLITLVSHVSYRVQSSFRNSGTEADDGDGWGIPQRVTGRTNCAVANFGTGHLKSFKLFMKKAEGSGVPHEMATPSSKADIPLQRCPDLYIKADTPKGQSRSLLG